MGGNEKRSRRKLGARNYADYSMEMLNAAVNLVQDKVLSSYEAEKQFGIPRRTIVNKSKNLHNKPYGRPTALSAEEESHIADVVNLSAKFGCPLTLLDLRIVVYNYLLKCGKAYLFKGKMPGERWARGFIQRHNFSQRATQNIKRSRASKTVEEMNAYFNNLETALKDVPASNILNFDETNLSDDPGSKKCIFKRGTKHPERVLNSSKSAVSIMFSGTADGNCLPPYVVYKADHLWARWCEDGPENARYNRTKSGWFDMMCFDDWFKTIVLPWANSLQGVKVIIGDNLASHLSVETIQICQSHNIRFVFLPKNPTHLTQPLDVAFFGPMKKHWYEILTNYKATHKTSTTINKCHFPQLLQELMTKLDISKETNLRKGFEGSGIFPFNPSKVIVKIPTVEEENALQFDVSLLEFLQQNRRSQPIKTGKNSKLSVVPGKSISTEEADELAKAKTVKKSKKITKLTELNDHIYPGPSKIKTATKKISQKKTKNLKRIDTNDIKEGATVEDYLVQTQSSLLTLKNPDSLCKLCVSAINIYLEPLVARSNTFVHSLKDLRKDSAMNTLFYEDTPDYLQLKIVNVPNKNPESYESPSNKKIPKVKILSNILIKEASPEKQITLQNKSAEINNRKKRQTTDRLVSGENDQNLVNRLVLSPILKKQRKEKNYKKRKGTAKTKKRKFLRESSSEDEDHMSIYSEEEPSLEDEEEDNDIVDPSNFPALKKLPKEGDFIIVEFQVKGKKIYYLAKVLEEQENETEVSFLRRSNKVPNSFHMPNVPDIATVALRDIKMILPKPKCSGITKRKQSLYHFDIDFSKIVLR